MQATPTTWKLLLEAGWTGKPDLKMLCGGEELTRDLAVALAARGASLWNMYGPTETTVWSSLCRISAADDLISIGRPIANTQIYIIDGAGQPVPIGVPGELCIAGDGVARGYWKRPELTKEKFVRNPFVADPQAPMYRTGDLAKLLADGRIVCLGRIDNQVKIRGRRIELGEIESALRAEPGVKDAAVVVREDAPGDKRLVAYVIPAQKGLLEWARFRNSLANRLPDYMIPTMFVEQDALPLTPNGKIDRKALAGLPAPSSATGDYVAPRTEQERTLAEIWQQVLRVERAGIHDDLFTLGADSIHLFQIASRAARQGLAITPKQLLQHRTIARLSADAAEKPASKPAITRVSRDNFRIKRPQ
jgi:acyl-coenzyme A synthetase/AMP-(fatty) acid ligase/aryl carrier-like protein